MGLSTCTTNSYASRTSIALRGFFYRTYFFRIWDTGTDLCEPNACNRGLCIAWSTHGTSMLCVNAGVTFPGMLRCCIACKILFAAIIFETPRVSLHLGKSTESVGIGLGIPLSFQNWYSLAILAPPFEHQTFSERQKYRAS
jgi:hypothetical protein